MPEITGLRNNALPYPVYGVPYGVVFPILDADGDPVTGATGLDSEVSKNGDTYADCTNEATEIATSSGDYYLLLTAAEMTADVVAVQVKTTSTGAKTTKIVLYPRKLVALRSGTAQGGAAGYITLDASAGSRDDRWNGCLCVATIDTLVEARIITDYTGSNQQAAVTPNWNVTPDSDDTFILYLPEGMQAPTVNVSHITEQSQTARDIGASVLLSSGTGTGQLDFTSGVVKANVTQYGGSNGTFASGRPEVNVSHLGGSTTPVTNLNTVFNTDFAANYNATADKWNVDLTHIGGTAITATAGILSVNTTQFGGSAGTFSGGRPEVNVSHFGGSAGTFASGRPAVNTTHFGGTPGIFTVAGVPVVDLNYYLGTDLSTPNYIPVNVHQVATKNASAPGTVVRFQEYVGSATTYLAVDVSGYVTYNNSAPPTAGAIADAVWDEAQSGHTTAGTFGYYVDAQVSAAGGSGLDAAGVRAAIGLASANLDTQLAAIDDYLDTEIGTLQTTATNTYNIVNSGTYGNSAIKIAVDALAPASDVSGSFNQTYGTVISGTYANTATDDNTRHVLAPDATNALDADYTFTIPTDNKPTRVTINGYFNGTAQYAEVYAYNYDTAAYVQLSNSTTRMNTRSSDANYTYELSRDYVEDGVGTVKIRFTSPSTNTAHRLHLDRILVYSLTEAGTEAGLTAANVWEYATRTVTAATNITSDGNTISQTQLAYLDAAVSTRLATSGYTAPLDAAGTRSAVGLASANLDTQLDALPTAAEIRTEIDSNSTQLAKLGTPAGASVSADIAAIAADTTSILGRIGAFAGSGVNNILGFLKAIMRKDASLPSDVGGTYAVATDSLEGQVDTGSGGISLNAERTAAFNALLDAVIRGEVVDDAGNTSISFLTDLTTANSHEDYTGQVIFFDGGLANDNSKLKRRIVEHVVATGQITLDVALTDIPDDADAFSVTGYQSSTV